MANAVAGALVLVHQQATCGEALAALRVINGRPTWDGAGREARSDTMTAVLAAKATARAAELERDRARLAELRREGRAAQWTPDFF